MKVYGPYLRKDGRKHVIIIDGESRRTVSYPKYLMEQKLGRQLHPNETADHIDRDKTNDDLGNLQVLVRREHAKLDSRRVKPIEITCAWCGKKTMKEASNLRGNAKQNKAGPFCSHSCSGKYSTSVQHHKKEPLPAQPTVISEYFYREK